MSGASDFDFFMGDWRVHHRRLKTRLAGCSEWEEFSGSCSARAVLGGQGNLDDNVIDLPAGAYRAATVRTFDPETRSWAIWWLDARRPLVMDTPVIGAFENDRGDFYAVDTFEGRTIRVRFRWTRGEAPIWEQAFSPDGGGAWETNWIMKFTRT